MISSLCRIELLGDLRVQVGSRTITRFATGRAATLLAYLACYPKRAHPREALAELLWPDADPASSRLSLRVALSSLRRQLEPPELPAGSVLRTDRVHIRLHGEAVTTDVADFEAAVRVAAEAATPEAQAAAFQEAVALYRGDFLPGCYDDWVCAERERLAQSHRGVLRQLASLLEQSGASEQALDCALRAAVTDPFDDEARRSVMHLYAATGQPEAALRHYREFQQVLQKELEAAPEAETQTLAASIQQNAAENENAPAVAPFLGEAARRLDWSSGLPLPWTRFFGRENEMTQVGAMLALPEVRLITLTGLGGAGKTRLSLEIARQMAGEGRRACFVPLAGLTEAGQIPGAILEALPVPPNSEGDALKQAALAISGHPLLLILDNFEHLIETGTLILQALVKQSPTLTVLVTSRQALDMDGEREFPVSPLPVPEPGEDREHLLACPSVHLFVDRAQAVRPDFQVTARNAASVAAVCRRLEGLPLALELAAAWGRTLTPSQIEERLAHRFDLLVSRRKDISPRHRTLWETIQWSYRMLAPEVQAFFAALSVFRGGWTLEAAEAVCEESQALNYLTQLRERSLVIVIDQEEEIRFRLLESLREFGLEQLGPEDRRRRELRHAEWCLHLAESGEAGLRGPEAEHWLRRLTGEQENLHAALEWSERQTDQRDLWLRLSAALSIFWRTRGLVVEERRRLERAVLVSSEAAPAVRANVLYAAGHLAAYQNELDLALARYRNSLALWRELGDTPRIADALLLLGPLLETLEGAASARPVLEECLSLQQSAGNQYEIAQARMALADLALHQGQTAEALSQYAEAQTIFQERGWKAGIGQALRSLGHAAFLRGDYAQAHSAYEQSLTIQQEGKDGCARAQCLSALGDIAWEQGALDTACARYEESLTAYQLAGRQAGVALQREKLGCLSELRGDYQGAETLYQESLRLLTDLGATCGIGRLLAFRLGPLALEQKNFAAARRLCDRALALFRDAGFQWDLAAVLCARAEIAAAEGETSQAKALRDECLAVVRGLDSPEVMASLLESLGLVAAEEHCWEETESLYAQSLRLYRMLGHRPDQVRLLRHIAAARLQQRKPFQAVPLLQESLRLSLQMEQPLGIILCLEGLGRVAASDGEAERAAELLGAAAGQRVALGIPWKAMPQADFDQAVAAARAALGLEKFAWAWAEGQIMTPTEAAVSALAEKTFLPVETEK